MRSKWVRISCAVVLMSMIVGSAAIASSLFGTTYNLGEQIQFQVEDTTTWCWGCCYCCEESLVLGWRVADAHGQVVYSVIHDAPVSSSFWQESWPQIDMNGLAVVAGQYKLYVDTSVGTLSRGFTLRDPCGCNWCTSCCTSSCTSRVCNEDVSSITNCTCRTALVLVETCNTGCFPLFWWGCNSCNSCNSGCP